MIPIAREKEEMMFDTKIERISILLDSLLDIDRMALAGFNPTLTKDQVVELLGQISLIARLQITRGE